MPRRPQKVLVLRRARSLGFRRQYAFYYLGYGVCGLVGGAVLAVLGFLLFLFLCDCLGVNDPAGNSVALLMLVVFELATMSVYFALVVRKIKSRLSKAVLHLPSYRRDPAARR
jgi:hypothetical protein